MATPGTQTVSRQRKPPEAPQAEAFLIKPPDGTWDYDPRNDLPPCPDTPPTGEWEINSARLWEGSFEQGRATAFRTRSYPNRAALGEQIRVLRESQPTLVKMNFGQMRTAKLRESDSIDWFSYGLSGTPQFGGGRNIPSPYIPLMPGPSSRQLYWADYFAMSAKAFEAFQHNPIGHRSVEINTEFVLGSGIEATVKGDKGQQVWDEFWKRNNMDERLEEINGDVVVYGEIFLRYFQQPQRRLAIRSLDPAGIYDILTDQEDWESVYFYHQQEQERSQLFAPPAGNIAPTGPTSKGAVTRYTIRQIPAQEIDHYRINAPAR
jgi:hypothetical protein